MPRRHLPTDPAALTRLVTRTARDRFGWSTLRPGQAEAMAALVGGRDALVVMPTGAGKSAVYQVAALVLDGPTVVVSPLIALQRDQVVSLLGVEGGAARTIDSQQSAAEIDATYDALREGSVEFVFVTPEQLQRRELVDRLLQARPSLVVVDEAHCVSGWGHDFRPDYLRLGPVVEALGHPPVVALTATAAPPVRDEIVASLGLDDPLVVVGGFDRPNIDLQVERHLEDDHKREAVMLRAAAEPKPGLVYVGTRKDSERYAEELAAIGLPAAAYHAGLPRRERQRVHDAFLAGDLDVVVATTAFGMGIDKPDVRFVLHAQVAESPDGYYQEIGRAGRDGAAATAVLFYREEDLGLRRFFASSLPKEPDLRRVVTLLEHHDGSVDLAELKAASGFGLAKVTGLVNLLEQVGAVETVEGARLARRADGRDPGAAALAALDKARERQALSRSRVEMMRGYADTTGCRRKYLLGYFGEQVAVPCRACDNCRSGAVDATPPAVAEDGEPFAVSSRVRHGEWGDGVVMSVDRPAAGDDAPATVTVLFETVGYRTLALRAVQERALLTSVG